MQESSGGDLLTLGAIETDCVLAGRAEDALAVETRLARAGRETLPGAVAAMLEPALRGKQGVLRINQISIEFDLLRDGLDQGELTRLWAARLAEAISAELDGGYSDNVAAYRDHGDFAAAYLEQRFGDAVHAPWAFADFDALRHVAASRAAVELLRARPGYLAAVARRAAARGRPDGLVERLSPAEIGEILSAAADQPAIAETREEIVALLGLRPIPDSGSGWRSWSGTRRALSLALRLLIDGGAASPELVLRAARVLAALSHLMDARPRAADEALTTRHFAARAFDHLPDEIGAEARAALAPFLADVAGRNLLVKLGLLMETPRSAADPVDEPSGDAARPRSPEEFAESHPERRGSAPETMAPGAERKQAGPAANRDTLSPFAGVALTLTTIRGLDLHRVLPPLALRETLVALMDGELRPVARGDALIQALAPADPRDSEPDWTPPPASLCETLTDAERAEVAAASGADAWARLLVARFAERLPGFGGSSPSYLRRQFLQVVGRARIAPDTVEVTLGSVPLGVVLSMAGMLDWQGPLPWLGNRDLVVEIRGR